jgi:hypothetical protein
MGKSTTKMVHLDDHDHCPPETLMIMKPSINPNMAPKVGIHFRSLVLLVSCHNIACKICHLQIEQELWI